MKGDYRVAAFANQGDIGRLVMDNKEQLNFEQPLIDFYVFFATGAQHGGSTTDGKLRPQAMSRPVGVITANLRMIDREDIARLRSIFAAAEARSNAH